MKKSISLLIAAMLLLVAFPAQAQFQWGIKAGANLSNTSLKDTKLLKGDTYAGFFVGPMVEFMIPVIGLGVDGALVYSLRGASIKGATDEGKFVDETLKQHAFEVPINLKYAFGLGKMASIFVAAGPQFGFDLKSDKSSDLMNMIGDDPATPSPTASTSSTTVEKKNNNFFKKSNFSVNVGVGAKLFGHLQVGVNYNIPIGKTGEFAGFRDTAEKAFSAKVKTWQISLAYLF